MIVVNRMELICT